MTLLHVAASPKGEAAISWRAAETLLARIDPAGDRIVRRLDLTQPSLPDADFAKAMIGADTSEMSAARPPLAESEILISELERTDRLVISTPVHNFGPPAALKAWIDQVVRIGRTFQSTPEGKIGSLADRETIIVIASGSPISPPAARQPDHLRPYMTDILACIGIRSIQFITVEAAARTEDPMRAAEEAVLAAIG